MAPTRSSRINNKCAGRDQPNARRNGTAPNPVSNLVRPDTRSVLSRRGTTDRPDAPDSDSSDREDIWDDIPTDSVEADDSAPVPTQHWWDGPAQRWRCVRVYLDAADGFENKLPKAQLDGAWTQEHEARLQDDWRDHPVRKALLRSKSLLSTRQFAALLNHFMRLEERTLWENTCFYFGCLPSDIISARHGMIAVPHATGIGGFPPHSAPDVDYFGSSFSGAVLWSSELCQKINDLLLHPVWEGRPHVLREAIKYVVVCSSLEDERYEVPAVMATKMGDADERTSGPHQAVFRLLCQAIDLVAAGRQERENGCRVAAGTGGTGGASPKPYLVCAYHMDLLAGALDWVNFWCSASHAVPSDAWKGVARRLVKPWGMLTDELYFHGTEMMYLDVLRQQRRWALGAPVDSGC
ncbi:hypothetical protein QBC42DRAFT_327368 [Cladorrhinum samala]|uniref:Uncharacterized protein n=1 Tax=Cladorrhinum samala TaxID=585594 RepID=A0AAV9HNA5_9PEZI|nr:hypothetical protein QBC42DRAFT_327368 [Cladorrhinum samala]